MTRLHMLGNADFGVYAMGGEAAIFTAARLGDVHLVEPGTVCLMPASTRPLSTTVPSRKPPSAAARIASPS